MSTALTILDDIVERTGMPKTRVLTEAGLSVGSYYHWENGTMPRKGTVKKLKRYRDTLGEPQGAQQERPDANVHADMILVGILIGSAAGFVVGAIAM